MYILGLNAYHGDVSAVLLHNGEVIAALEEERFRRIKHWAGFPTLAIQRCLTMAGISGIDVDHVAISRDPKANLVKKGLFTLKNRPDLRLVLDRVQNSRKVRDLNGPLAEAARVVRGRPPAGPLRRAPPGAPRERVLRLAVRGSRRRRDRRVRRLCEHVPRAWRGQHARHPGEGVLPATRSG